MSEDLNPVVPAEEQPVEIKEEAVVETAAESVPETEPENTKTDFSNKVIYKIPWIKSTQVQSCTNPQI